MESNHLALLFAGSVLCWACYLTAVSSHLHACKTRIIEAFWQLDKIVHVKAPSPGSGISARSSYPLFAPHPFSILLCLVPARLAPASGITVSFLLAGCQLSSPSSPIGDTGQRRQGGKKKRVWGISSSLPSYFSTAPLSAAGCLPKCILSSADTLTKTLLLC